MGSASKFKSRMIASILVFASATTILVQPNTFAAETTAESQDWHMLQNAGERSFNTKDYTRAIELFTRAIAHAQMAKCTAIELAELYDWLADCQSKSGLLEEAKTTQLKAVANAESAYGQNNANIEKFLGRLALIHQDLGEYSECEKQFNRMMKLHEGSAVEHAVQIANIHMFLGELYLRQSKYSKAVVALLRAIPVFEKNGELKKAVRARLDLSTAFLQQGETQEAETQLAGAMQLVNKLHASDSNLKLDVSASLAEVQIAQGKFQEAEAILKQVLEAYRQEKPPNKQSMANVLNRLGVQYHKRGMLKEARECLKDAYALLQHLPDDSVPKTIAKSNLDRIENELGQKNNDPAKLLKERLHKVEKSKGDSDPELIPILLAIGIEYFNHKNTLNDAVRTLQRALDLVMKAGPESSLLDHLQILSSLGNAYKGLGDNEKEIEYLEQAFAISSTQKGKLSISERIQRDLGYAYLSAGSNDKAISMLSQAVRNARRSEGQTSGTAGDLSALAIAYLRKKSYAEAASYIKDAIEIHRKIASPPDQLGAALVLLSDAFHDSGDFDNARLNAKEALSLVEKSKESEMILAIKKRLQSIDEDAKKTPSKTLAVAKSDFWRVGVSSTSSTFQGDFPPEMVLGSLRMGIELYLSRKDVETARGLTDDAIQVAEKTYGMSDPRVPELMDKILGIYERHGLEGSAETFKERACFLWDAVAERILRSRKTDPKFCAEWTAPCARALINYAKLLARWRHRTEAVGTIDKAVLLLNNQSEECGYSEFLQDYIEIGKAYTLVGAYTKARSMLESVLADLERVGKAPAYARSRLLSALALNALPQNDRSAAFSYAERMFNHELEASKKDESRRSVGVRAEALDIMASVEERRGRLKEAVDYASQAYELRQKLQQPMNVNRLASLLLAVGDESKAFDLMESTFKSSGKEKPEPELVLLYSSVLRKRNDSRWRDVLDFAGRLFTERYNYQKNRESREIIKDLTTLAAIHAIKGDKDMASMVSRRAAEDAYKYVRTSFPQLSFGEQCLFAQATMRDVADCMLTLNSDDKQIKDFYSLLLSWKGLITSTLRQESVLAQTLTKEQEKANRFTKTASNQNLQSLSPRQLIDRLQKVRADQAAWFQKLKDPSVKPKDWTTTNDRFTREKEALQRELTSRTQKSGIFDYADDMTLEEFQKVLKEQEAFVDVYRFNNVVSGVAQYGAIVVGRSSISFVSLGAAQTIDKSIRQLRTAIIDCDDDTSLRTGVQDALWKPIAAKLSSDTQRILISPDGELARLPWPYLVQASDDSKFVSFADSARELVRIRYENLLSKKHQPFLVAAGDIDFKSKDVSALPATAREVNAIAKIAVADRLKVDLLTKDKATPHALLAAAPRATTMHIASHGYFESLSQLPTAWRNVLGVFGASNASSDLEYARNPLLSSGLILAPPSEHASGKLSAEEIVGADFSSCDLVTLSACDTGSGEQVTGQGVVGLRSSIMAAGARSVLMSLWKVPDEATSLLMTTFYENLWQKRMSKAAALRAAQKAVEAKGGMFKKPWYWAAWVLGGDSW